jgi:hypothetical protein
MGQARITTSRLLGIALLAMTSAHCCPRPLSASRVPSADNECRRWDPDGSADEIRRLSLELRDELPDWTSTADPSVHLDYRGLKAAAIKLAGKPECVQRAVIREYPFHAKGVNFSGLYLLMRVLVGIPSDAHAYSGVFPGCHRPEFDVHPESNTIWYDPQWPVNVRPQGGVLEIERCQKYKGGGFGYTAIEEYYQWTTRSHFPMRTPAEIEALEIREAP